MTTFKNLKFTLFALVLFSFLSCKKGGLFCYRENGNIITEERFVDDFDRLVVSTQANVFFEQSTNTQVLVETSDNLQEIILTEVKENVLHIDKKKGKCIKGNPTINVYVKSPELTALSLSGSGIITNGNELQTPQLDLKISGSGNINLTEIESSEIEINLSGSGNVSLFSNDTLDHQLIDISGSGRVNSFGTKTKSSNVRISGSGIANVHAIDQLTVDISGSGSVIYKGDPNLNSNITGSGTVKHH